MTTKNTSKRFNHSVLKNDTILTENEVAFLYENLIPVLTFLLSHLQATYIAKSSNSNVLKKQYSINLHYTLQKKYNKKSHMLCQFLHCNVMIH